MRLFLRFVMAVAVAALAAPAQAGCVMQKLAELPVTMDDQDPITTAKVDGHDTRFLIDSGAFFSFISRRAAAESGLRFGPAPFGLRISGLGRGSASARMTTARTFTLGGVEYHEVQFLTLRNGNAEAEAVNTLGQNVLNEGDVEYDLASGIIRIFRPQGCGAASLAYWAANAPVSVVDLVRTDNAPGQASGMARLNGQRIRFTLDTGSTTSLVSLSAAAKAGVTPRSPGVESAGDSAGVGRDSDFELWRARFASFVIGTETVNNPTLLLGDTNTEDGPEILLGTDFFLSHRILVSFSQHRIYFTYNGGPIFDAS